ncbi:MAG: acyl-CoA dehydrogenase [Alphaproteobacteria bacterium]|nr:acyl-CoA dehydrogenase [Alphaproteobacteria bacterium]
MLTPEHAQIGDSFRRFVEREINPHVDEWERAGAFPAHELFAKLGRGGFLGINKPAAFGGMGLDYSYQAVMVEALGYADCGSVPMAIGIQTDMATPALARHGSDELKREFLAPSIAGNVVSCLGVSEVGAGSDVAAIRTTARHDGGDYVINGGKMWITNGAQADWMCLLANTGDGPRHRNKSLICLPMKAKGITVARTLDKLGMRASDTAQIFFDDVRVPRRHLIGEEGMGFTYQMQQFQEERLWVALSALIHMERAIEKTVAYARERQAFGRSILDNQVVHFRMAELQTEIELLRSLSWRATAMIARGEDATQLCSMAKLKAGRLLREVSDSCLQYWGGMGFMWDNPVSRMYRDSRLDSIGGGADEIMLTIICKQMGILPGSAAAERRRPEAGSAAAQ